METQTELTIDDSQFDGTVNTSPERSTRFKLSQPDYSKDETETVFIAKILPALPAYRDKKSGCKVNGKWQDFNWAFFHQIHWGYKALGDDNAPHARPFVCPRKYHYGKMVEDCQECIDIKAAKDTMNALALRYGDIKAGKDALKADAEYIAASEYCKIHSLERRWHMAVITPDDKVGVLTLSKTTFEKELYPLLLANTSNGAFDINGGFYVKFVTTGNGFDKVDKALIYTRKEEAQVNGKKLMVDVQVPAGLSQAQKAKVLELVPDISTVRAVKVTSAQVEALIKAGVDDFAACSAILADQP